jgi:hypothetical protein
VLVNADQYAKPAAAAAPPLPMDPAAACESVNRRLRFAARQWPALPRVLIAGSPYLPRSAALNGRH